MSLAPLSGLFVGIVLALLGMIPDGKHVSCGDLSIYRQPRKYACVFFVCGVLFASIPWWAPLLAPDRDPDLWALVQLGAIGATVSFLYLLWALRYRVELSGAGVKLISLRDREIYFRDVVSAELTRTAGGRSVTLRARDGTRIRVWGSIADFQEFVKQISKHVRLEGAGGNEHSA
jgi:hypothetical protein